MTQVVLIKHVGATGGIAVPSEAQKGDAASCWWWADAVAGCELRLGLGDRGVGEDLGVCRENRGLMGTGGNAGGAVWVSVGGCRWTEWF